MHSHAIVHLKITKRRLLYLAFGMAAFLAAYSTGAALPLTEEEAEQLRSQFSEQVVDIDEFGIFLNNFGIDLLMFIPAAGAAFGLFAGLSTGAVFTALAMASPELASIPPLAILITPFGIMEVFAYGLAISRSGMLFWRIVKDKPWRRGNGRPFLEGSVLPAAIEIGIAAAVLGVGAIIEWQFIEQLGGLEGLEELG